MFTTWGETQPPPTFRIARSRAYFPSGKVLRHRARWMFHVFDCEQSPFLSLYFFPFAARLKLSIVVSNPAFPSHPPFWVEQSSGGPGDVPCHHSDRYMTFPGILCHHLGCRNPESHAEQQHQVPSPPIVRFPSPQSVGTSPRSFQQISSLRLTIHCAYIQPLLQKLILSITDAPGVLGIFATLKLVSLLQEHRGDREHDVT